MFVHSAALSIDVEPDPWGRREVVALTYRKDPRESPYFPQVMELGISLFHQVAVALVGGPAGLRSVELPHQPLSPVSRYAEFFRVDVGFGSPAAALRVERQVGSLRLRTDRPGQLAGAGEAEQSRNDAQDRCKAVPVLGRAFVISSSPGTGSAGADRRPTSWFGAVVAMGGDSSHG
ncbi:AraC family transcriptional regulator [Streptomyces sp. NBC_01102]|uniref:AraC family transcriptional regulator ligand-binding domain-containing protein n=1 Tax=Streptomyces sp. NBC_01102 TaxID=2903749 RepID=UPI003863D569|nr:AraC family transcriptional regulator [Streptomyces sp. NBC_01102]